jgi:hypothetical protein
MIPTFLREEVGVDPNDAAVVLDLASIGITNGTWRNSPLEDWHAQGRIDDGGMLRANVATTKLVREAGEILGAVFDDEEDALTSTEDLAGLDSDFTDELFTEWRSSLRHPGWESPCQVATCWGSHPGAALHRRLTAGYPGGAALVLK